MKLKPRSIQQILNLSPIAISSGDIRKAKHFANACRAWCRKICKEENKPGTKPKEWAKCIQKIHKQAKAKQ